MTSRRLALAGVSLAALTACTTAQQQQVITSSVQTVYNSVQFVLPLLDVLALGISVTAPAAAGVLGVVTGYLNQAAPIFQTLVATMTVAEAQPLVQQIEACVKAAVDAVQTTVQANQKLAAYQGRVAQAQAVVGLLTAFVNGVQQAPAAAARATALPMLLHK